MLLFIYWQQAILSAIAFFASLANILSLALVQSSQSLLATVLVWSDGNTKVCEKFAHYPSPPIPIAFDPSPHWPTSLDSLDGNCPRIVVVKKTVDSAK